MTELTVYTLQVLAKAREKYGISNQILVSMEELNELACVCAKFPRYSSEDRARQELRDKALDEVADVYNALNHIEAIFGLTPEEIQKRAEEKAVRLNRWLSKSDEMDITTIDRQV
mgnify:CR=1 FL=1